MAVRNILRQRSRTAMTLAAIVCGVAGLILGGGWVNDIFAQLGEALIHSQSGHLQIYQRGYHEAGSRTPEKFLIARPDPLKQQVAAVPGVASVMARLNFSGLLNNGRSDLPVIGVGVEPDREAALGSFVAYSKGRALSDRDAFGIEVGVGVAQALKLEPGDRVTLLANALEGALNTMDFEVVGVFQSFSADYDARAVKIPLSAAQELIVTPGVNAVVVTLARTEDTSRVAAALTPLLAAAGLELKTWLELNDFYTKTVDLYSRQFGVLQFIILVMVILSVANTVNMSVFERVGEFGTMMSLGNRSRDVFRLIMLENALLGAAGAIVGAIVGVLLAMAISAVGIPMPPPPNANMAYTARIQLTPTLMLASCGVGFAAAVLAALLPARRVSRTPVVEALRQNV